MLLSALFLMCLLWQQSPIAIFAQPQHPPAVFAKNEGGPVAITGKLDYTNAFFTIGTAAPMVILEDQAGFIDRDAGYILPLASQTLGPITSDFYTSPFSYTIALPIEPQAALRDVDNDGEEDVGVMVFAVAYWANTFGDPFLEKRDLFGGGWSTSYASTRVADGGDRSGEIVGGTLLVYAPDDKQGFPSSFGVDGLLFTDDDPIVALPPGYTMVTLDSDDDSSTFQFDRSRYPSIPLVESDSTALEDYSALSYSQAFDALVTLLARTYAYTEHKAIDWAALHAKYRPRIAAAEAARDDLDFQRVLRDFAFEIPDGHVNGPFVVEDFRTETAGGLGMAVRELDDGRYLVDFLLEDGPAAEGGIELGAEILAMDGLPMSEHVEQTIALSAPFSTDHFERLQKLRYAVRSPLGSEILVGFRNPRSDSITSATLISVAENESFRHSSFNAGIDGFQLPLEFEPLENGFGYVKLYSFSDNELLTVQLWERLIHTLNSNRVPGLVIDVRQNGGGSSFLAHQLAAYFFEESLALGNWERYDEDRDIFLAEPATADRFLLPPEELRYDGAVAVLVGPNCNSACEFFARDMALQDRAAIVGHYPTAGLGGAIDVVALPENVSFQYTVERAVGADNEILIEGAGVAPSIRVPVDERTLFDDGEPLLDAAVQYLNELTQIEYINAGQIELGEAVSGRIEPNTRMRYTVRLQAGDIVDIYLSDDTRLLDTVLRLYSSNGTLLASNDDAEAGGSVNSSIRHFEARVDLPLIVEVATYGDAQDGDYELRLESGEPVPALAPINDAEESVESLLDALDDLSGITPIRAPLPASVTVRTEGARLSARSGPGSEYERIAYLPNGSTYDVLAITDDDIWIQLDLSGSTEYQSGWVAAAFVETGTGISDAP